MLTFHVTGNWTPGQVQTSRARSTRAVIPEVERVIEDTWDDALRQSGVYLFDGPMCRLESWRAADDSLHLVLSRTTYKAFLGTNMRNPQLADEYTASVLANPVGVSPAVVSSDNFLLLGRRNASVAYYPHKLHPFAGAVEPRHDLDVFDEVRRELREELSFENHDVADVRCTGIVEDVALRQPELIFAVRATRTRAEIESRVDQQEHGGSWSVPATRDELGRALQASNDFTPVAVASLLLWGRTNFGDEWFVTFARHFRYDARATRDSR